jgi:PPOX class probable F420-dependent enzyme
MPSWLDGRHLSLVNVPGAGPRAAQAAPDRYRLPMSVRQRMSMSEAELADFLVAERRAQVGTINADGTPHVVPLSYVMLDGRMTFWTDPRSRKVANLRRDPRMTCLVEAGAEFAEFRAAQLVGRAELGEDHDTSLRAGLALFERANGQLDDTLRAVVAGMVEDRVAITLHRERLVTWDHRKLPRVRPGEIGS